MRFTTAALLGAGLAAAMTVTVTLQAQPADGGTTTWDGVYTAEQATRGEAAYTESCSSCHGPDLGGDGFAPALTGSDFANTWNGTTLADIFDRIRTSMPPDNPGSVSAATTADIIAFVLKSGQFPAGTTELASQAPMLKMITFAATKPDASARK